MQFTDVTLQWLWVLKRAEIWSCHRASFTLTENTLEDRYKALRCVLIT